MTSGEGAAAGDGTWAEACTRAEATWGPTLQAAAVDPDDPAVFAATLRLPPGVAGGEDVTPTVAMATGSAATVDAQAPTRPEVGPVARPLAPAVGALAGEFVPGVELGAGGVGVVHLAHQPSLDREVALKTVRAEGGARTGQEQAFVAEAWITAALDHPGIVPVYALGRDGQGRLALAMKRVVGAPWSTLLREQPPRSGPNALRRHLDVFAKVVDAVAFAHDRGVLHRDLKPQNVMVGDYGQVYVVDWGLALRLGASGDDMPVAASTPCGTPAYMAPEMADGGGELSLATDVYLLGAILHEVLTGRPPHRASNVLAVIVAASRNEVLPIACDWEAPQGIVELAGRCLATDPAERFATAGALREALERFLSGEAAREEAEALSARAAAVIDGVERGGDPEAAYAPLLEADALLQGALVRWAEFPGARTLRRTVHARLAEAAVAAGDLVLARSFLDRLVAAGGEAAALEAELERRRRESDPEHLLALDHARQRTLQSAAAGALSALVFVTFVGVLMRLPGFPFAHWDDDGHPAWAVTLAVCVASLPIQGGLLLCLRELRPGRARVYRWTQALVVLMFALSLGGMAWGYLASRSWGDEYWALLFLLPIVLYRGVLGSLRAPKVRALFAGDGDPVRPD